MIKRVYLSPHCRVVDLAPDKMIAGDDSHLHNNGDGSSGDDDVDPDDPYDGEFDTRFNPFSYSVWDDVW